MLTKTMEFIVLVLLRTHAVFSAEGCGGKTGITSNSTRPWGRPWEIEAMLFVKGLWNPNQKDIHWYNFPGGYNNELDLRTFICRLTEDHRIPVTLLFNSNAKGYYCEHSNYNASKQERYEVLSFGPTARGNYSWLGPINNESMWTLDGAAGVVAGMSSSAELLFICRVGALKQTFHGSDKVVRVAYPAVGVLTPSTGKCEAFLKSAKSACDTYDPSSFQILSYYDDAPMTIT